MKIILNAGHTKTGAGCGAVGFLNESDEARRVVSFVKDYLEEKGHDVIMANVDKAESQSKYLREVVNKANKHPEADIFVSVHFNAGGGQGCECYTWRGKKTAAAVGVCSELNKWGFRNRGVKDGSGLYVIKKTIMNAVLIEVCFVDNRKDVALYKGLGAKKVSQAIVRGILNG